MKFEDMLELYYENKIDFDKIYYYLDNIKKKIISNYPLIDFSMYENNFVEILKKCLDNYNNTESFIKVYYEELNTYFNVINKEIEYMSTCNYLNKNFNFNVEKSFLFIKEIEKFLSYLGNNNIFLDYELYEKILKEYPKIGELLIKFISDNGAVSYKRLKDISAKDYVLDFLELALGFVDVNIIDEIDVYESKTFNTNQLLKHKILSKNEILDLFNKYKNGDERAKNIIIEHHFRLVARIANRFSYNLQSYTFDDLFQEGVIGLNKAIERFEVERGNNFTTYAIWWIRQAIENGIGNFDKTIRIPKNASEKLNKIKAIKERLEKELQREVSFYELSIETGISEENIKLWLRMNYNLTSLDKKVDNNNGDDSNELNYFLKSDYNLEEEVINNISFDECEELLSGLTQKEKEIIKKKANGVSLRKLGKEYNLSRERIRQIEKRIRIKLYNNKKLTTLNKNDYEISLEVDKINFNDYFLGISTIELKNIINMLSNEYKNIIYNLYDKNLKMHSLNNSIKKLENKKTLFSEIIPYIFMMLYELGEFGKIKPIKDIFAGLDLNILQKYIIKHNLNLITKRYGCNLNELNYLNDEELKKLYSKEIPKLYNFYLSQNKKSIIKNLSLRVKYEYLTFNELVKCIKKLSIEEQNVIYQIYGYNLAEFNILYLNENVIKKLDEIINEYNTKKNIMKDNFNSEVVILSSPKTFLEKYKDYSVEDLKSIINNMHDYKNVIYMRYGANLDEFNEIDKNSMKKLLEGLEAMDNYLKEGKYNMAKSLIEQFKEFTKEELMNNIGRLTIKEQNLIFKIYGDNLDEAKPCLKASDKIILNNAVARLKRLLNGVKISSINEKRFLENDIPLIERYNLDLESLKNYVNKLTDYKIIYIKFGLNLNELNNISKEQKFSLNCALDELERLIPKEYHIENECNNIDNLNLEQSELKKVKKRKISLKEKYPDLDIEELKKYINLLNKNYIIIIYKVYGKNLDEYNKPEPGQATLFNNALNSLKRKINNSKIQEGKKQENLENIEVNEKAFSYLEDSLKSLSVKHYIIYMILEGKFNGKKYEPEKVAKMFDFSLEEVLDIYNDVIELMRSYEKIILKRN